MRSKSIGTPLNQPWYSPDGRMVGAGDTRYSTDTHEMVDPEDKTEYSTETRYTPDGSKRVCVSRTAAVLIEVASGEKTILLDKSTPVRSLAMSIDGRWIALGDAAGRLSIWSTADGTQRIASMEHGEAITAVAFNSDAMRVATGGMDHRVHVWDATSGQRLVTFSEHAREISGIVFTADGSRIISSSGLVRVGNPSGGDIWIWDAATGQAVTRMPTQSNEVYGSVAITADDTRIYASADDVRPQVTEALRLYSSGMPPTIPGRPIVGRIVFWGAARP